MIPCLFPTLLVVYTALALATAKIVVDSYDEIRPTMGDDGFAALASWQRVTAVVVTAALWPLVWLTLFGLGVYALASTAWARRSL
jgi:hypothetical protein